MRTRKSCLSIPKIIFGLSLLLPMVSWGVLLPLSFTTTPTYTDLDQGSTAQNYQYVVKNNTPITLPLTVSGVSGQVSVMTGEGSCGSTLAARSSCNLWVRITPTIVGAISQTLSVDYHGRYPLTSAINLNVTESATLEFNTRLSSGPIFGYTSASQRVKHNQNPLMADVVATAARGKVVVENTSSHTANNITTEIGRAHV